MYPPNKECRRSDGFAAATNQSRKKDHDNDGSIDEKQCNTIEFEHESNTAYLIKAGTEIENGIGWRTPNCYIGRYGDGPNPVINEGFGFAPGSKDVTVENLHIQKAGQGNYYTVMVVNRDSTEHITVANCLIQGIDTGSGYPHRLIHGATKDLTLYHNEWCYSKNDAMFLLSGNHRCSIISNYIHHANMDGVNAFSAGDGIQFEYDDFDSSYVANNFIDRSHTMGKFALIVNGTIEGTVGFVCEWNTFIGPRPGGGGATVRWYGGGNNIFRKNFVYTSAVYGISSDPSHAYQEAPYGIHDNVLIDPNGYDGYSTVLDETNLNFVNMEEYLRWRDSTGASYGCDLDTSTFRERISPFVSPQTRHIVGVVSTWKRYVSQPHSSIHRAGVLGDRALRVQGITVFDLSGRKMSAGSFGRDGKVIILSPGCRIVSSSCGKDDTVRH